LPGILGTVFDSCSLHEQDLPATKDYFNKARYTKLTMMTGGPYPLSPNALPAKLSSADNEVTPPFMRSLLDQLQIQLGRRVPDPVCWRIRKNEACIPTLLPDHLKRMEKMNAILQNEPWAGRLEVIGAGVGGVSVPDCIEAGRQVGKQWG